MSRRKRAKVLNNKILSYLFYFICFDAKVMFIDRRLRPGN